MTPAVDAGSSAAPRFAGERAIVTGGASGIGAAIARRLAADGAEVWIADIDRARGSALAQELGAAFFEADVCQRDQVDALVRAPVNAATLLVTAAGGAQRALALDLDEASFATSMQLNAGGFWRCAQAAARRSLRGGSPLAIVHVASSLHAVAAPELAHFAAAKAASVSLVRTLALEFASANIRVNAVVPGPIDTPMTQRAWQADENLRTQVARSIPLGRIGAAGDVANAACWLLSREADYVTGCLLAVDGGLGVGSRLAV